MLPAPLDPDPIALQAPPAVVVEEERRTLQIDETLRIEFPSASGDLSQGRYEFSGGVIATYGVTTLRSESLVISSFEKRGEAFGEVELTDPEGTLRAARLVFDWAQRTGSAEDAYVRAGNMRLWAKRVEILPDRWILEGVRVSLDRREDARYSLNAKRVELFPGRRGTADGVSLDLFGVKLGTLPRTQFNLDRRVTGFRLPTVDNRPGFGLGINWTSSFLVDDQTGLTFGASTFPKAAPSYGVQLSTSPLAADRSVGEIGLVNDLGERFSGAWFDSVTVLTPELERAAVAGPRLVYGVGTSWNQETQARAVDADSVSKMLEMGMDYGTTTPVGALGFQVRGQRLRAGAREPWLDRATLQLSYLPPEIGLVRGLSLYGRVDGFGSLSRWGTFSYARTQVGLLARPTEGVTLGAAFAVSGEMGSPDYGFDRVLGLRSVYVRADYRRGPATFRYLAQYDLRREEWMDQEFEIAWVVESFEPFVVVRDNPSAVAFGIRFRIDDVVGRLQSRSQQR